MKSLIGKLTEEEARELWEGMIKTNVDAQLDFWEQKGYIKENPVEKAKIRIKEIEKHLSNNNEDKLSFYIIDSFSLLENAIKNLEKQIEELKK